MQGKIEMQKIVLGVCLVLLMSCGILMIIGSGGGDSDDPPPPPPKGASRFINYLYCRGNRVTAGLAVGGKVMNSTSGQWSGCLSFAPGTYPYNLLLTTSRCGTIRMGGNVSIAAGCTKDFTLRIEGNFAVLRAVRRCPGSCPVVASEDASEMDLVEEKVVMKVAMDDIGLEQYDSVE